MKRNVVAGLGIAWMSFLGCWGGFRLFSQSNQHERNWSGQPFVAHIGKRFYASPADNRPTVLRITYARRADRSYAQRTWGPAPDGSSTFITEIADAARNEFVMIEPLTRSVIRSYYSSAEFDREFLNVDTESCSGVPAKSGAEKEAPLRRITGLEDRPLAYWKVTHEVGNDKALRIESEKWLIREYECFPAKYVDTRGGHARTEWEIDSLVPGAPDPSHFEIPADYEERSYMAMELAYKRMFQGRGFFGDVTAQELDRRYWLHRTPQARASGPN